MSKVLKFQSNVQYEGSEDFLPAFVRADKIIAIYPGVDGELTYIKLEKEGGFQEYSQTIASTEPIEEVAARYEALLAEMEDA